MRKNVLVILSLGTFFFFASCGGADTDGDAGVTVIPLLRPTGPGILPRPLPPLTVGITTAYKSQPRYQGDCRSRRAGETCLGFGDDYIWLVSDAVLSSRTTATDEGRLVEIAVGQKAIYYHVPNTLLVRVVPR